MLKRELISLIIVAVLITGNIIEYMITSEPTWIVNFISLPTMIVLLVLQWICKPYNSWLNEKVGEQESKPDVKPIPTLSQHLKERAAAAIREFGVPITSNMKALYWPEEDVFIILWCNHVLMYSDKPDCSSITSISTKYTDKDLEKFLDYAHKLIIDNMPKHKSKA
jgi:hypothetical protein